VWERWISITGGTGTPFPFVQGILTTDLSFSLMTHSLNVTTLSTSKQLYNDTR